MKTKKNLVFATLFVSIAAYSHVKLPGKSKPNAPMNTVTIMDAKVESCDLCCCMFKDIDDCQRHCHKLRPLKGLLTEWFEGLLKPLTNPDPKPTEVETSLLELLNQRTERLGETLKVTNTMCQVLCLFKKETGKDVKLEEHEHHHE